MDKYEFNIKVDQIKKLAGKRAYREAAEIASGMNWQKVKDWSTLAMIINIQEAAGDYEEARDMAILAYNRNLGGRKLVYKLTEIFIKLGDFANATQLYEEYAKMSQHDVNRYILLYHLKRAQKAPDHELVEILEEYKSHEIDEKYMYRLADLYAKTNRRDECIKTCDDIVLWFQDGKYVEGAVKLKKSLGAELTTVQQKIYEQAKNKREDLEQTRELLFAEQTELARLTKDDVADAMKDYDAAAGQEETDAEKQTASAQPEQAAEEEKQTEDAAEKETETTEKGGLRAFFKKAFAGFDDEEDEDDEEDDLPESAAAVKAEEKKPEETAQDKQMREITAPESKTGEETDTQAAAEADAKQAENAPASTEDEQAQTAEEEAAEQQTFRQSVTGAEKAETAPAEETAASVTAPSAAEPAAETEAEKTLEATSFELPKKRPAYQVPPVKTVNEATLTLKELIEQAKKKIDSNYERINREEQEEKLRKEKEEQEMKLLARQAAEEARKKKEAEQKAIAEAAEAEKIAAEQSRKLEEQQKRKQEEEQANLYSFPHEDEDARITDPETPAAQPAEDMDIRIQVPNYNLYDTQNIQAAIARNLSEVMKSADDAAVLRPLGHTESAAEKETAEEAAQEEEIQDDQIEGQLSLADWMETVKEEKYGKQNTKQYSKAELERMLDEKEEKSAAYDRLMEEQRKKAAREGRPFDEAEAGRKVREQMMLHAARTDLAIRTGKATLKLEEAIAAMMEEKKPAVPEKKPATPEELAREAAQAEAVAQAEARAEAEIAAIAGEMAAGQAQQVAEEAEQSEEIPLEEIKEEPAAEVKQDTQSLVSSLSAIMEEKVEQSQAAAEAEQMEERAQSGTAAEAEQQEAQDDQTEAPQEEAGDAVADDAGEEPSAQESREEELSEKEYRKAQKKALKAEKKAEKKAARNAEKQEPAAAAGAVQEEKRLPKELEKLFRKYSEMPGLEGQLVTYFEALEEEMERTDSAIGNIMISGNSSSDKTDLARTIVKAVNYLYPESTKKIAKTTGESINQHGVSKAMEKLRGTALIVESAGAIQPKRISELLTSMKQDTGRMIVILEDADAEMNVLIKFNPELAQVFNHHITLKQYTVNELVEIARQFARRRQYEVDDDALLELYLKIDKLHAKDENLKMEDIREVINKAIARSEKRSAKRFFGGIKKKRGDKGDIYFLTEADFKD